MHDRDLTPYMGEEPDNLRPATAEQRARESRPGLDPRVHVDEADYAARCGGERRFVANTFMRNARSGKGFSERDRAALAAADERRALRKVKRLAP